ncbi:DsrE family protein [Sulfurisphaera javensis]|uniref:DsrE family protein n=1 Tax=Sulfurisphaera javensis TaxID=2049879 RepID=A0AAT9GQH8_9CREN
MPLNVIVQIKDEDKVMQGLRSVINLYNDLKDAVIEVVFHQSAIKALLKDSNFREIIEDLMSKGIIIVGCENSIKAQKIKEDSLISGIRIVTSGVGEIVRKQSEGWIYLVV